MLILARSGKLSRDNGQRKREVVGELNWQPDLLSATDSARPSRAPHSSSCLSGSDYG